ncbi:steroid delta-isomerase [Streptacidiphilus sp. MAP12-33]|uniref:nuclear transport factor 2 family protein n=1 Tax=Streptacidiphilus sp. MAP12-33 TaxID=3156266 RepID=UPI003516FBED
MSVPAETTTLVPTGTEQVLRFYAFVDGGDADAMSALFAPDAVYQRPGYPDRIGPEGLHRFYTQERTIRDGGHVLHHLIAEGPDIAVFGEFHGTLHSGAPVDLRFADYFGVGRDGLFTRRETYFFAQLA